MTAIQTATDAFQVLPLQVLVESEKNPRKHFDQAKLEQLADSIGKIGVLTPLIARPMQLEDGEFYELAAGHRRFRASKLAGLTHVPVRVVELDDVAFLEVLTIENLQRDDLHPIEEAHGYADLMKGQREGGAGYDVQRIADRVGKSVKYVYDRIKLLDLIPKAQTLFLEGRITAGHAILIARLKAADQERVIDPTNAHHGGAARSGLWTRESASLFHPEESDVERGELDGLKAVSVRELETWIDRHVRLDLKRDAEPLLFPAIAEKVTDARDMKLKVIAITYDPQILPEAKAEGERTYGPRSWKRADGLYDSETCEFSVLGAVVVGPARGEAFQVCIKRDKCRVHWKDEIRAEKRADTPAGNGDRKAGEPKKAQREIDRERQAAAQKLEEEQWAEHGDAVVLALATAVKKASVTGTLGDFLLRTSNASKEASKWLPRGRSADELIRHLAFQELYSKLDYSYGRQQAFAHVKKLLGVDLGAVLKTATTVKAKPESTKAPKKPASKPATPAKKKR
jgi:ParB/RepB/Spo0J family partition protein